MDRADGCHHRGTWRSTLLGSRALPPGCTELSEEHILLGEQIVPSKSFWNMLDTLGGNILQYIKISSPRTLSIKVIKRFRNYELLWF